MLGPHSTEHIDEVPRPIGQAYGTPKDEPCKITRQESEVIPQGTSRHQAQRTRAHETFAPIAVERILIPKHAHAPHADQPEEKHPRSSPEQGPDYGLAHQRDDEDVRKGVQDETRGYYARHECQGQNTEHSGAQSGLETLNHDRAPRFRGHRRMT